MELFSGKRKCLKYFATVYTIATFKKDMENGKIKDNETCLLIPQYIYRIGEFTTIAKPVNVQASSNVAFVIICKQDYMGYIAFLLDSVICKLHFFKSDINRQDNVRVTKKALEELQVIDVDEVVYNHYALVEQMVKMLRDKLTEELISSSPAFTANTLTEVRDAMAIELIIHPILEKFDVRILDGWMQAVKELRSNDSPAAIHAFVSQTLMPGSSLLNNIKKMTMVLNNINKLIIEAQENGMEDK